MRFGVMVPHLGYGASPEAVRDASQAAEDLGYDSLWVADHVAPPRSSRSFYGLSPAGEQWPIPDGALAEAMAPLYECVATLIYVAGLTRRVQLGSAVCVLPLRNPVYNAKQLATVDALSGGRLLFGVGSGWLQEEAEGMQMPWDHRGARTDEHIAVLRAFWTAPGPYVSFHGRFYSFEELAAEPHPAQSPPPILIGGHSAVAKERAGRIGDGWLTSNLAIEEQASGIAEVRAIAAQHGRDPNRLLFVGAMPVERDTAGQLVSPKINTVRRGMVGAAPDAAPVRIVDRLRAYREAGTAHVFFQCWGQSPDESIRTMRLIADEVLPEFRDS